MSPSDGVMITAITNTSNNFTRLTPGTSYTVTVACINKAGTGESSTVTFHVPTKCQSTMSEIIPTGKFIFVIIIIILIFMTYFSWDGYIFSFIKGCT